MKLSTNEAPQPFAAYPQDSPYFQGKSAISSGQKKNIMIDTDAVNVPGGPATQSSSGTGNGSQPVAPHLVQTGISPIYRANAEMQIDENLRSALAQVMPPLTDTRPSIASQVSNSAAQPQQ